MSCLICMAVYDTVENERTKYTYRTLACLGETVNLRKHNLLIINNNSCAETWDAIREFSDRFEGVSTLTLEKNIGTARAINQGIRLRGDRAIIKIDNDVVINEEGWVDKMEYALSKLPKAGIIALKRKDLAQSPTAENPIFKTQLSFAPHLPGEPWVVVEESEDIMGTCTLFSLNLMNKVGYMRQPGLYGFDDSIYSRISVYAGFNNYFLPCIDIDHIDAGDNPYMEVKRLQANEAWEEFQVLIRAYKAGKIPLYYDGGFKSSSCFSS